MKHYAIGVDLGGTNLRAAAVDVDGEIVELIDAPTEGHRGNEAVLEAIAQAINQLRDSHGRAGLLGIGVGVPGFILIDEGIITDSPNLPSMRNYPMRDLLSEMVDAPVILENDANAAALGEKWMGAGRDVNDMVLLTLGTGVGGGIILNGKIWHGMKGMGAEIGHITVNAAGNPCGCGNIGCLEKHASATALRAMADMLFPGEDLTPKDLNDLANNGDEKAKMAFDRMGDALGIAIATLSQIFNVPLYVLGGGVLPAWPHFAPRMLCEVERRSFNFRYCGKENRVVPAELGGQAGLIGAAYLPISRQKSI
ncbi:MAG: ROK family protein [Bryobacterales bacterium]|nr:ROK family protein [Bryobacterales bacterium]